MMKILKMIQKRQPVTQKTTVGISIATPAEKPQQHKSGKSGGKWEDSQKKITGKQRSSTQPRAEQSIMCTV